MMIAVNSIFHLIFGSIIFGLIFHCINGLKRPNILIIVADDMGFDDLSFRGSNEFITPNIDALAYSGVILNNFYAAALCTPSRSALLTGKYPIHTGMQHYAIANSQPWGLPTSETTMAEIFKSNGYFTSLIGKWDLGFFRKKYTPTYRGFDSHFGYFSGCIDYYDQTSDPPNGEYARGHDFRKNLSANYDHVGTYVTHLLTQEAMNEIDQHDFDRKPLFMILAHLATHAAGSENPLEAPEKEINKFKYISDKDRRTYAAMASTLDDSVGKVIDALNQKGILNETIIVFLSDNGGPTQGLYATTASNFPLRGQKNSPWEGGIRTVATIWTSKLLSPGSILSQKVYIGDLLPTLASAADIVIDRENLDGLDMWQSILQANQSNIIDREIVHNIDPIVPYTSYLYGKYKFINGTTINGTYDGWLGRKRPHNPNGIDPRASNYENVIRNTTVWKQLQSLNSPNDDGLNITELRMKGEVECPSILEKYHICEPLKSPCLFDIDADPCEMNNLYEDPDYADILASMLNRIEEYGRNAHAPNNEPPDSKWNPALYDFELTWWKDIQDERNMCGKFS